MKHFLTKEINGYTVKWCFVDDEEIYDIFGQITAGTFVPSYQIIYINTDQHLSQIESALRHENLEAINYYNGIGLTHKQIVQLEGALSKDWDNINFKFEEGE